jgi:hypothetical protein
MTRLPLTVAIALAAPAPAAGPPKPNVVVLSDDLGPGDLA